MIEDNKRRVLELQKKLRELDAVSSKVQPPDGTLQYLDTLADRSHRRGSILKELKELGVE